jgi:hypothetical protein
VNKFYYFDGLVLHNSTQFHLILIGTTTIAAATVTKSSWGWVVESEALSEALNVVSWREIISLGSHTREYLQKLQQNRVACKLHNENDGIEPREIVD